jgi:iron complex outermembrane receptor protein
MKHLSRAVLACFLACGADLAYAQTTKSIPESDAEKEPVTLSTFEVRSRQDFGYQATNSITASGIGTKIIDAPINISVLTSDFINDRGFDRLEDVLSFVPSATTDGKDQDAGIRLRGLAVPTYQNGVRKYFGYSLNNVERIEVVRGPSSVFHGLIAPGGVVNMQTYRPQFRPSTTVELKYGSYDYTKSLVRTTGPLGDKFAYLVAGAISKGHGEIEYTGPNDSYFTAALTFQPNRKFSWTVSFENLRDNQQIAPLETTSHPAFDAAQALGVLSAADYAALPAGATRTSRVFVGQAVRAWLNLQPQFGPNEPAERVYVDDRVMPYRNYNINGPQGKDGYYSKNGFSEMVWEASDWLTLRALAARDDSYRERIQVTNFRIVGGDLINNPSQLFQDAGKETSIKLEAALKGNWHGLENLFLAGYEYRDQERGSIFLNGPSYSAVPYNPRTQLHRNVLDEVRSVFPVNTPIPFVEAEIPAYYASYQMGAFENRVRLLLGARHTTVTQLKFGATPELETSKTTPQVGLVLRPVSALSLFANYSETFEPQNLVDVYGRRTDPRDGKGWDIGVKTDYADNKLAGTVSVWSVENSNIAVRDFPLENQLQLMPLYNYGKKEESAGVDAEIAYTPQRNYQLVATYSWTYRARTAAAPDVPQQVGVRLNNVPEHAFNVWNKYTFVDGPLKGVFVGGGARYSSEYRVHPSWSVTIVQDPFWTADLMIGYKGRIRDFPIDLSLNVNNVTDKEHEDGVFQRAPGRTATLTARFTF